MNIILLTHKIMINLLVEKILYTDIWFVLHGYDTDSMDDVTMYSHLLSLPDTLQSPSPVQKMRETQVNNDATIMNTSV